MVRNDLRDNAAAAMVVAAERNGAKWTKSKKIEIRSGHIRERDD